MNNLKQYIRDKNWVEVLNHCKVLNPDERAATIAYLHALDIDRDILAKDDSSLEGPARLDFHENRQQVYATLNFALIACTRQFEDIAKIKRLNGTWQLCPLRSYLSNPTIGVEPLMAFYRLFPPDYLHKIVKVSQKERFDGIDFKVLWAFYQQGWITFDESYFVARLLTVDTHDRNTEEEADFLLKNPAVIDNVFLQFHRYEIPVLDLSKWEARTGYVCKKVTEYWTEVIQIMQEKGYVFNRAIIPDLMESLLNNWKKPHLDWHIRLLGIFNTTQHDYLQQQQLLFSLLNTSNTSLINFSVRQIKTIYKMEGFDENGFIDHVSTIFPKEKIEKSLLLCLDILEHLLKKEEYRSLDISADLSMLLLQTDSKVQEKGAQLLVEQADPEVLKDLVEPHRTNLKLKTLEILGLARATPFVADTAMADPAFEELAEQLEQVTIPSTWDALLFQIGHFIRTKSALDFDLFLEGLNQLQNDIPNDYKKQLKPYCKQLFSRFWDIDYMRSFADFMHYWIGEDSGEKTGHKSDSIPFAQHKLDWMRQKLVSNNSLPFLSTPSHLPFYLHPNVLIKRLLAYEQKKVTIEIEDLIVACNRLLYQQTDEETIRLVKTLKGNYASAMQYFLGATDQVKPTADVLALWAQVTRIKQPDQVFPEFEHTSAKSYPAVVNPFEITFEIVVDKNEYATWHRIFLEHNWNYTWCRQEETKHYPPLFYHTAPFSRTFREAIAFQLSLTPQYIGPLLCRYIPDTASGNEVPDMENCLYPMQFVMDNRLEVQGSGWLYIAVCLLFEKKISRDLATEYVQFALLNRKQDLSYLADIIGRLLAAGYAPVNRFIEYLDRPFVAQQIKEFQFVCLEKTMEHLDNEHLPVNSKKLVAHYVEVSAQLQSEVNPIFLSKVKRK
ncbi:hypothetical protein HS960_06085 [Sphingobacterium paramultivorum]|uniref:Uncharacterized protein n=1 Tax=Sphingobacterium paramultivorum TaxID=2886510 RepID=A0A7G5DZS8_9SPHI|nr:DUF6493 family protein [Sphingobacterium paramultivorum]QMV67253.1 hypothetical protein HS960_06085 [Sphingobacterium paramultivorum]WSO16107.1 DUF6493 family protein [Sphingobacterium paramultivorum]